MIRKAKIGDLENIMSLINLNSDTFSEYEIPKAEKSIKELINGQDKENRFYVFTISDRIVGCAGFSKQDDTNGVYFLNWLAVHPDSKRRGVGTELYKFIEAKVRALNARLIILNSGSGEENQYFYEKMGFKQSGIIPKYYNESKDLIWRYKLL